MDTVRLNAILVPDEKTYPASIQTSQLYANEGGVSFVLDGKDSFPHLTLYFPEYPRKNIPDITEAMKQIAAKTGPMTLEMESVTNTQTGGIHANYQNTPAALELSKLVIKTLNPIREGCVFTKYANTKYAGLNEQEINDISTYGYIISRYHFPHITLSHFKDVAAARKALKIIGKGSMPNSCLIQQIALTEVGVRGTATKILERFDLK